MYRNQYASENFNSQHENQEKYSNDPLLNQQLGKPDKDVPNYQFKIGFPNKSLGNNEKSLQKYSLVSIYFIGFFEELIKSENIFFIFVIFLEMTAGISVSNQVPWTIIPFFSCIIIKIFFNYLNSRNVQMFSWPLNEANVFLFLFI